MAGMTSGHYSKVFSISTLRYRLWRNKYWKTFQGIEFVSDFILALQGMGVILFSLSFYFRFNDNIKLTILFRVWFVIYWCLFLNPGYSVYKNMMNESTGMFSENLKNITLAITEKEIGLFFNQGNEVLVAHIMDINSVVKVEKFLLQDMLLVYGKGKEMYRGHEFDRGNREPVENRLSVIAIPLCFSKYNELENLLVKKCGKFEYVIDYFMK